MQPSGTVRGALIQTTVSLPTLRKLDALARACGHKRAGYLRHLVELHVRALPPKLATSVMRPSLTDEEILKAKLGRWRKK